jgi:predicted nucleic acid-binding protein
VASEYVIDASIAASALAYKDAIGIASYKRVNDSTCHAPHLLDAEVGQVLRRAVQKGEITEHTARTALATLPRAIDFRYPHNRQLVALAWDLRHTITFYDGLYVALATILGVPLLTADVKLSKAPGLSCPVEVLR